MLIYLFTLSSLVISIVQGQMESPCPDILRYEPRTNSETDRWYGEITLKTSEDLEGLWLKIVLDRKAELLGNWFADAVSKDNIEYSIKNPSYTLAAGPPVLIRFFVKYNAATIVPTVKKIALNGKQICPEKQTGPTEPTLHLSKPREPSDSGSRTSTTSRPIRRTTLNNDRTDNEFNRPVAVQSYNGQCGTVAQRPSPLISHGQSTTPGQWPWHVALYRSKGLESVYTCGGTLLSNEYVVTAAHCVTRPRTNNPVDKQYLVVYLGKYNLKRFGSEVQQRELEHIIVHPDYNSSVYYNDIALLKLSESIEFNNLVRPCCLWEEGTNNIETLVGIQGTVVGWGFDENKQISENLMQAQMPIVSTRTCLFSNRNFFSQFIFDKNFCAGFNNGTSVCNGDSGGGMVIAKPNTRGQNTIWQLRGIVSVGVALQGEGVCDPDQYVVFTDAAKYVSWIKQTIF